MYKEFDMRGVGKKSTLSKTGFGATTDKLRKVGKKKEKKKEKKSSPLHCAGIGGLRR